MFSSCVLFTTDDAFPGVRCCPCFFVNHARNICVCLSTTFGENLMPRPRAPKPGTSSSTVAFSRMLLWLWLWLGFHLFFVSLASIYLENTQIGFLSAGGWALHWVIGTRNHTERNGTGKSITPPPNIPGVEPDPTPPSHPGPVTQRVGR